MVKDIKLENVSKKFEKLSVFKNINLEIFRGEFLIFLGPSGCGKSTLLRIMSGLEKEYDGKAELGQDIKLTDMSFVFQQFALLPWLTVYKNIELGLLARKMPKEQREEIVKRELKIFGLEKFANVYPKELSGGMKQRVGIARALATNPKIIFMDEPFSELDSFIAEELRQDILEIWKERRPTIVMVTHIIEEAVELADRVVVLSPRPTKIKKVVINNIQRPRHKRSPEFYKLEDELHEIIKY